MYLCEFNPQLLSHDWAKELVNRLGGRFNPVTYSALIQLIYSSRAKNTEFTSTGFKLLWHIEKNIHPSHLKTGF